MKRVAKIFGIVVAVIIILIIIAIIVLPMVFNPNDYKDEITSRIEARIGREVTIPGKIELSVFPWLGIDIGRVTIANDPDFGDKPMAEIASADVHVKVLPFLLHQQIKIGTVSVDGLRLRVARDAQGHTNWESIVEHLQSSGNAGKNEKPAKNKEVTKEQKSGGGFNLQSLQISAIQVSDARITWRNVSTGKSYKISNFHLTTGTLAEDHPFSVDMGAKLVASKPDVTSHLSLSAIIHPDISQGIYKFSDLNLQLQADGGAVPGGSQNMTLTGHGVYNLNAGQFALKDVHVQAAGLDVSAQIAGKGLNQTPSITGKLAIAQFDPRAVAGNLGIKLPQLQGDNVLQSASMKAQFSATPSSAKLGQLRINLDDTTFTGSANVTNFTGPAVTFNANVNQFNLDHYLPVGTTQKASGPSGGQSSQSQAKTSSGKTKIDLSMLEDLMLDGTVHVGSLTAYDMNFNDATLKIEAHNGVLTIKPLDSGFYDGSIHIIARVDASGNVPHFSVEASLAGLKFKPLLEDLVGTDVVSALANLKLNLSTTGGTVSALKHALDGTFQFELKDGAFHGFNLASLIAVARSQFLDQGSTINATGSGETTPFNRFAGKFSIHNGTISGDGMSLDTKYLNILGSGSYNIVANDLDYTLKVNVDKKGGPLSEVSGLTIPIQLTGGLFSPDYSIDIEDAIRAVAQQKLQEQKKELKQKAKQEASEHLDEVQKKLKKELGDQLGGSVNKKLKQGVSDLLGFY